MRQRSLEPRLHLRELRERKLAPLERLVLRERTQGREERQAARTLTRDSRRAPVQPRTDQPEGRCAPARR